MKKLLLLTLMLTSCYNEVKVPTETKVGGELTVKHIIEVSAQLETVFERYCTDYVEQNGLSDDHIDICIKQKTEEYITKLLNLLGGLNENN